MPSGLKKVRKSVETVEAMTSRYERAQRFEQENWISRMVINTYVWSKWIGNTDSFVYKREVRLKNHNLSASTDILKCHIGLEYRLVDCRSKTNILAFDHEALAFAIKKLLGRRVDAKRLPITELDPSQLPASIVFAAFDKRWKFYTDTCVLEEIKVYEKNWLISPDGKKAAFLRDYNLWVTDIESGEETRLTSDGQRYYAYGGLPERADIVNESSGLQAGLSPQALWSPDSKWLFTHQTDERHVCYLPGIRYVPMDGNTRPRLMMPRYSCPGDQNLAVYFLIGFCINSGEKVIAKYPHVLDVGLVAGLFQRGRIWWSEDSKTVYFVDIGRREKNVCVVAMDISTGVTRILFEEVSDTYAELSFLNEDVCSFLPLPATQELLWWSERSGWAHLYLYDLATGEVKTTVTKGSWLVREIIGLDFDRREVYFQAAGRVDNRDPYYCEICRANLESGDLTVLASGDHNYLMHRSGAMFVDAMGMLGRDVTHASGLARSGNYFVATRTRIDEPSVSELRDRQGNIIMILEKSDISGLPTNWKWPEPVQLVAADGKTDIYGSIFRPTDFDADKQYPVIDYVQVNPAASNVPKSAFCSDINSATTYFSAAALAELGFVVVLIDGRGSTQRDKAFHDESYDRILSASNLEDHVAGIRQLWQRYSYMDLERVGITGPGGCNGPAYGIMAYPDFYKVAVANSIYDPRLTHGADTYQQDFQENSYDQSVLSSLVKNLKGELFLVQGMLDNFYHPAGMLQLVDALVQENKKFDMLMLPNGGHMWREGYPLRRAWDYMVLHLQQNEPPLNFELKIGHDYLESMSSPIEHVM